MCNADHTYNLKDKRYSCWYLLPEQSEWFQLALKYHNHKFHFCQSQSGVRYKKSQNLSIHHPYLCESVCSSHVVYLKRKGIALALSGATELDGFGRVTADTENLPSWYYNGWLIHLEKHSLQRTLSCGTYTKWNYSL